MDVGEFQEAFPRFAREMSQREIASLVAVLRPRTHAVGERLVEHGKRSETAHFITSGQGSIRLEAAGETLYLGVTGPGGVVGELGLIEPGAASATVEAIEPMTSHDLSALDFEVLCSSEPGAASGLLHVVSLELAQRIRRSGTDILRRIDDHAWMRATAKSDRGSWVSRLARLFHAEGNP